MGQVIVLRIHKTVVPDQKVRSYSYKALHQNNSYVLCLLQLLIKLNNISLAEESRYVQWRRYFLLK